MKNVIEFNNFKDKKTGDSMIKENTIRLDDVFRVMGYIDIPVSLINAYFKKVQDETGKKLREIYSDTQIAEMMCDFVKSSYLNIENFPVELSLGTGAGKGHNPTTITSTITNSTTGTSSRTTSTSSRPTSTNWRTRSRCTRSRCTR